MQRISFSASEQKSFENVDGWTLDGKTYNRVYSRFSYNMAQMLSTRNCMYHIATTLMKLRESYSL